MRFIENKFSFNLKVIKRKNYLYNSEINFLIRLFIIIIIPQIYLSRKKFNLLRKINQKTEIIITLIGSGTQQILGESFTPSPDKILIEGIENQNNREVNLLNNKETNISLIWDFQLKSCFGMFSTIKNLKNIYFIDFDTSLVNNMSLMFHDCSSLIFFFHKYTFIKT